MKNAMNATKYSDSWSNVDKARFHYFSPFGMLAQKDKFDKEINALVNAGKCKSGAIVAYGSLNYFHTDNLRNLATAKRVTNADLFATLIGLDMAIQASRKFIQEVQ